jgi:hypothetical protein
VRVVSGTVSPPDNRSQARLITAAADRTIWAASWAVPAAGEQPVLVQTSYGLVPIGWVQSALRALDDAPNQREGAPRAWIRFDEQVAEGAKDLRPGEEIVVLTGSTCRAATS